MTARRGRRAAWLGAGAILASLGLGVYLLQGFIVEELAIRDLRSAEPVVVSAALEKLALLHSHRAVPALVALYVDREEQRPATESDQDDPTDAMEVVRVAARIGPRALAAVMQATSEHEVHFLASLLRKLGDFTLALATCLEHSDPRVRRLAALGLRLTADQVVPQLEARLQDDSEAVRCAAAWSLAGVRPRALAVRKALAESLKSARTQLLEEALIAFASVNASAQRVLSSCLAPQLAAALAHPSGVVARHAAAALRCSRRAEAIAGLIGLLGSSDESLRYVAMGGLSWLLGQVDDRRSARAAGVALVEAHGTSLDGATSVLCDIALSHVAAQSPELLPALLSMVKKGSRLPLQALAAAVRSRGRAASAALPTLIEMLTLPIREAERRAILDALPSGSQESHAVLPALLARAREGVAAMILTVARIAPDAAEVEALLKSTLESRGGTAESRAAAASGLGYLRRRETMVVDLLLEVLEDSTEVDGVRAGAAEGLGRLGPPARKALSALERRLTASGADHVKVAMALWRIDPRWASRCASLLVDTLPLEQGAFEGLLEMGPMARQAVPALLRRWSGAATEVASIADASTEDTYLVRILHSIGKPAVPALLDALRAGDPFLRSRAAETIGLIGPAAAAAIPALEAALTDADDEVRREAAKALPRVSALRELHRPPDKPHPAPPRLAALLQAADGTAITTREAWEAHRRELRERWASFLGEIPTPRVPLAVEILATEELTRVTRHHVRYAVEEGVLVDGYLLVPWNLPTDGSRRAPGVVVFHQTVETHAQQPAGVDPSRPELHIALHLAGSGFVTLAPRCFIFAEGADYREHVRRTLERHPSWKGMTRMLLDGVRAADCLASLPYVDPSRLGCIGHSLGAKEALYAAAFDERYRAAVFSEGGIGLGMTNWEDVWYLGPECKRPEFQREHHELLALVAPRAFLLLAGGEGGSDDARAWSFIEAALPVFRRYGAEARFGWRSHGYGHDYPGEARGLAEAFLDQTLAE